MGVHPNIHIPKESFPQWIWYTIECVIVIAASLLLSKEITNSIEGISPEIQNYIFIGFLELVSWFGMLDLDALF